jgi:hypothetical protein
MLRIHLRIGDSAFVLEKRALGDYVIHIKHGSEAEEMFPLAPPVASLIFERAAGACIQAAPSDYVMAVGGRSKQLTLDMGLNAASFRWWQSVPAGWEELEEVAVAIERASFELVPRYIPGGE